MITLSGSSDGTVITTASAKGRSRTTTPPWPIATNDAIKSESNDGSTEFTFTVKCSDNTTPSNSARWVMARTDTNAAEAADFVGGVLSSGTFDFETGETSKRVPIEVSGDSCVEPNEDFSVSISTPSAGTETGAAGVTGPIENDVTTEDGVVIGKKLDKTLLLGSGIGTVIFFKARESYRIGIGGEWVSVSGPGGNDYLSDVELLPFGTTNPRAKAVRYESDWIPRRG